MPMGWAITALVVAASRSFAERPSKISWVKRLAALMRVLNVMRRYIDAVEKNERHVFRGQLSDIPIEDILNESSNGHGAQQQLEA